MTLSLHELINILLYLDRLILSRKIDIISQYRVFGTLSVYRRKLNLKNNDFY